MKTLRRILPIIISIIFIISTNVFASPKSQRIPPAVPSGLTTSVISSSEIDLSWNSVSDASGYKIFRAETNNSNYTQIATLSGTTFKSTGLKANTTYWYYIQAYNSYGTSAASTHVSAITQQISVPTTPTGLSLQVITSSEVDLSWNIVTGADGYEIYIASPDNLNYTLAATLTGTTYKSAGLNSGTTYWYYVKAYNSSGSSGESTHISAQTLPVAPVTSKFFLGFATYYYSGDPSSYNSMVNNTSAINEIATDTYTTDSYGNITGLVPTSQITYANNNGIKPVAMITNNFSGSVAQTLLESSTNRQALIANTLNAIKANNYQGVNVDLEGIYSSDRSYFTTFMKELYNTLNPLGYEVSVCVPAKTVDSSSQTWNYAYDYASLAQYSDRIVIMAYDEHYPGGSPGAVASIGWVQNVANYAVTVIPRSKILLGIAAYGYDWSSNGTKAYSVDQCYNLASTYNATILWDAATQSPYFTYTDNSGISHTLWFENSTSVGYKLDIVNNMNLAGAGMWRLGLENAAYWSTIKTKLGK